MAQLQALCMKCRQKGDDNQMQDMTNLRIEKKNNRYSARGECGTCGTGMFKFLSKDKAMELKEQGIEIHEVEDEE